MVDVSYLDDERKKLWGEIDDLKAQISLIQEDVQKKTTDYEEEAKEASIEARNLSLECKASHELAIKSMSSINNYKGKIEEFYPEMVKQREIVSAASSEASIASEKILRLKEDFEALDEILSGYEDYESSIATISTSLQQVDDVSSKINAAHSNIVKRKKEVDDLYFEIFGYEEEGEDNNFVNGLKHDLDQSYDLLKKNLASLSSDLSVVVSDSEEKFGEFILSNDDKVKETLSEWRRDYLAIQDKIKELLPDALTAGLSHAFSVKREAEIKAGDKLNRTFKWTIGGLVAVSIIPFGVDAYLMSSGRSLEQVLFDTPRLLAAILPLYVPLLWLAYTSNKRANLSKRLVEEYTHKEVLSKTFEGLSNQIDSLDAIGGVSDELRVKLLYNLLDVSAENPGKLISNYQTSDHPLIDALEQSSKLSGAIDKLEKIPGLTSISKLLERTQSKAFDLEKARINKGLAAVKPNDNDNEESGEAEASNNA